MGLPSNGGLHKALQPADQRCSFHFRNGTKNVANIGAKLPRCCILQALALFCDFHKNHPAIGFTLRPRSNMWRASKLSTVFATVAGFRFIRLASSPIGMLSPFVGSRLIVINCVALSPAL